MKEFGLNQTIKSSNKRHILKTFSWRGVGTLDTIILGWIITGNPLTGIENWWSRSCNKNAFIFWARKIMV